MGGVYLEMVEGRGGEDASCDTMGGGSGGPEEEVSGEVVLCVGREGMVGGRCQMEGKGCWGGGRSRGHYMLGRSEGEWLVSGAGIEACNGMGRGARPVEGGGVQGHGECREQGRLVEMAWGLD